MLFRKISLWDIVVKGKVLKIPWHQNNGTSWLYLTCQLVSLYWPHLKKDRIRSRIAKRFAGCRLCPLWNRHSYSLTGPHRGRGDVTKDEFYLTAWEAALPSSQAWGPHQVSDNADFAAMAQTSATTSLPLTGRSVWGKRPKGFSQGTQFSVQPTWNRGQKPNTFSYIHKILKIIFFSKVPNWKEIISINKVKR